MALIDLRQIKNGVQLQNDVNQAKQDITRIESTVIPGVKTELTKEIAKKVEKTAFDSEKERVDGELALKATKAELTAEQERVNGELAKKAVKTEVTEALKLKADQSALEAETERVNTALGLKADQSALVSGLAGKVDTADFEAEQTRVDGELAKKANAETLTSEISRVEGLVGTKAERAYVDTELGKKAVKTEVESALAEKATKAELTAELAKKADTEALTAGLALKANTSDVESTVQEIEGKIGAKADSSFVNEELAKKASKTELSEGLAGKADKVHRHNVSDIDGLGTVATLNTGVAQGNVPVLGVNGKLAESVIPSIAVNEFHVVRDQEAAMELEVQNGDIVHIDPLAELSLGKEKVENSTFICVNASAETFEERFRPLNAVGDSISRAEVLTALESKADKVELTSKIDEAKAFATTEAQREAGVVDGKLTSAKEELNQSINAVDVKVTAVDEKVDSAKGELQGSINTLAGRVTVNEGSIGTINEKVSANEQAIEEIRGEIADILYVENVEVFVATDGQESVTLERDIREERTVKVYVNGFKLSKGEFSIAGRVITFVTEKVGYTMGEGFVIEVTYC